MTVPVVAVVGYSGSGKTRVASALVRILTAKGYRIVAVKHAHHGHQVDLPGKDTAKLFHAGAAKVIAVSPGQVTSIERSGGEMSLDQAVAAHGGGYDLVIAEGFKGASVPKVLVAGMEPLLLESVIAVVSDAPLQDTGAPVYSFADMDALALHLEMMFLRATRAPV